LDVAFGNACRYFGIFLFCRHSFCGACQTEQSGIVFKIQILTSSRPLAKNDKRLKGLKDVDYYKEGGIYKYTYGASPDYNKVLRSKRSITDKFKDAFIIAFKNGEKINVNTAISEFKKNRNK
jgi:N-acetylmuramoyl-L-alanine amidase